VHHPAADTEWQPQTGLESRDYRLWKGRLFSASWPQGEAKGISLKSQPGFTCRPFIVVADVLILWTWSSVIHMQSPKTCPSTVPIAEVTLIPHIPWCIPQ
jgi:hypothetical protein